MGQHKYNPTAQAAKRGELPPKPEKMSKREVESIVFAEMYRRLGIDKLEQATGFNPIYWGRKPQIKTCPKWCPILAEGREVT